jgi:ABC-type Fe3+ transport system permease subunit
MTERELGEALMKLDATQLSGTPEARQLTWKVLERDRHRVRLLSGLSIAVWVLAVAVIVLVLVGSGFIFPFEALVQHDQEIGRISASQRDQLQREVRVALHLGALSSVAVLTVAALCTILLVFASRRATLRQVNASLVEISEQLKQLRQTLDK